ncbi:MAG: nucleoside recognition protein [Bacteroidaceae bacterium]|nr:nucleoside recognition protein [Bacteroidaceae bacterium]MBQ9294729.1 nucleoside recognition protein [Bacteroidaceae bacterium]
MKTTSWLLKIMIPISFAVCLMQYYGIIAWCAKWLNPLFCHIGLPGASSIAFLTGATATTYAALAVMMTMQLTLRQATIIAIMVLICHALPLECTVNKKVGSKPFRMALLRIVGAILAAIYLNIILPDLSEPFSSISVSPDDSSIGFVLRAWLTSSVKLAAMIFAIIYALMFVQKLMERYGLMQKLTKPLAPLMVFFGLPRNASYLWLVGNVLGISYGSAVMLQQEEEGKITRKEANEVNYHLIMNHSMLEDTLVFASAGVSALWILTTRLLFALLLVWGRKAIIKLKSLT